MRDKKGNYLTFSEYMKRWKDGIEGITPLQRMKSQQWGTRIQLIGISLGIVISLIAYKLMWWIGIILTGAFINTFLQYIASKQQIKVIEKFTNQFKEEEKE